MNIEEMIEQLQGLIAEGYPADTLVGTIILDLTAPGALRFEPASSASPEDWRGKKVVVIR